MNWREVPFVRLLLPFVSGVLLAVYLPWQLAPELLSAGLLLSILALFSAHFANKRWRQRWLYGALVSIFLMSFGWLLTLLHDELRRPDHFQQYIAEENTVVGTVLALQSTASGRARLRLQVFAIQDSTEAPQPASGYLLAYLDSTALTVLNNGDRLLLTARIVRIEPPKNPKAFDFARYMHFKNVHYQAFVASDGWRKLSSAQGFDPMVIADQWRDRCIDILRRHFPTENELAVASALILGYRDEITEEVRTAYANTGAMHVLAVSGLHVGFIYLGLGFLMGRIPSDRKSWKIARFLLEISGIWAFALLTGASASVLRAATMFSFMIVGKVLRRDVNIYNTLAASAFLLLGINPYLLLDVGFQLSYLAVLGIVYFQPKIYKLWYVANPVGDYIWKLTAVSLAAQITTLPISLYYFHQLPLYFWLSGLVVVPVAPIILCGGFLLFATDFIPGWNWLLGKFLWSIVKLVNHAIFLIEQLPGNLVSGIWVSLGMVLLLYAALVALVIAIQTRQFRWILIGLGSLTAVAGTRCITQWQAQRQQYLAIYHIPKHTAIDFFAGRAIYALQDEQVSDKTLHFANQQYRWYRKGKVAEAAALRGDAVIQLGTLRIAIVENAEIWKDSSEVAVDYVLMRGNPRNALSELLAPFVTQGIVFDASNNRRSVERWLSECEALGMDCYDIGRQGAFLLRLANQ